MRRSLGIVIAGLMMSGAAYATPAWVQSIGTTTVAASGGSGKLTLNGVTAGDLLVVFCSQYATSALTVTDSDSNTVVQALAPSGSGNSYYVSLYYIANASAGTHTETLANGSGNLSCYFAEFSGVATSSPEDGSAAAIAVGNGTAITANSVTPSVSGDLAISFYGSDASPIPTITWGTPLSGANDANGGYTGGSTAWGVLTGTSAFAATATIGSTATWAASTVLFKPSGAASTCAHDGYTSTGTLSIPNGTSGSYWLKNGTFGTPDCSTVNYWQPTVGNFGVN